MASQVQFTFRFLNLFAFLLPYSYAEAMMSASSRKAAQIGDFYQDGFRITPASSDPGRPWSGWRVKGFAVNRPPSFCLCRQRHRAGPTETKVESVKRLKDKRELPLGCFLRGHKPPTP